MVRADLALRKIARAAAWLDDAERTLTKPLEAYVADVREADLASFYLFLAIQECIDLAAHWVSDAGWPPADDVAAMFDVLAERDAIPRELADSMRGVARVRNRIAHGYATIDHARLHTEASAGIASIRRFLDAVARAASA